MEVILVLRFSWLEFNMKHSTFGNKLQSFCNSLVNNTVFNLKMILGGGDEFPYIDQKMGGEGR